MALNEVAAQAAIAWVLLTEETSLRKLLMLAGLRRRKNVCGWVMCDAGTQAGTMIVWKERGSELGGIAGSAYFDNDRRIT